ncbi:hypothetical protein LTR94_026701, partial [Friedmanniomyces endolithicus]
MSRMPALLATAALAAQTFAMAASPALASDPAPSRNAAAAQNQAAAQAQAQAARPRTPATAEVRAAYDRTDALSRSVFWAQEREINPTDAVAGIKLSQALRELGRYDQAAETAQGVLTL